MMKDCLTKPIKVVNVCDLRVGDFIHDISFSSMLDSEKRKGYVTQVAQLIESRQMVLRLSRRKRLLEVPTTTDVVITQASLSAETF